MADDSVKARGSLSTGVIPKKDLDNLVEQLQRMHRDSDRTRLINTAAQGGHRFTVDQLWELISCQHFGDAKNNTAIMLYPCLVDPERFPEVLDPSQYYPEDIAAIKSKLNLK